MKTHRNLGLAALVVFIISFFLPAFEGMSGFASFAFCWDTLLGHEPFGNIRILSGVWFYYSGFVMSNILFVGLVVALFVTRKIRRVRSVLSVVCFLQALSWLVLFTISGKPSQITAIKVGYYVWLIAYGLLVTAHPWKRMFDHWAETNRRLARRFIGGEFHRASCDHPLQFLLSPRQIFGKSLAMRPDAPQ
ncbi:MAG TPA: hypothetical protein VNU68_12430 [Verrucomicrobiae bacterium]|nr:hypothetical protein [Verrucomicrobiae bacterium]